VGLLTDGAIRDKLMELFLSWKPIDREISIKNADIINLEKIGPHNTSMHDWINYFAELALEGLSNRSHQLSIRSEEDLLIPYLELFQSKGVPGLFRQSDYINSNKNLKEFIRNAV